MSSNKPEDPLMPCCTVALLPCCLLQPPLFNLHFLMLLIIAFIIISFVSVLKCQHVPIKDPYEEYPICRHHHTVFHYHR